MKADLDQALEALASLGIAYAYHTSAAIPRHMFPLHLHTNRTSKGCRGIPHPPDKDQV